MFSKFIYKRTKLSWHIMFFTLLNLGFIHVIDCLSKNISALDKEVILSNLSNNYALIAFCIITLISLFNFSKKSIYLLVLYLLLINFLTLYILIFNFNKLILFLLFQNIVISYFYVLNWSSDLNIAAFNPNYSIYNAFKKPLYPIRCILTDQVSLKKYQGYLTNWDIDTCFIKIDSQNFTFKKYITVDIIFDKIKFRSSAIQITKYHNIGIGVNLISENDSFENTGTQWYNFSNILRERGLYPNNINN